MCRTCETELSATLEAEHPCNDFHGCDIAQAASQGLFLWAAHILVGATECEATEAAYAAARARHADFDALAEAERVELCKVEHIACPSCNSIAWDSEDLDTCPSCNAVLRPLKFYVIHYTHTGEDDFGYGHAAIVEAESPSSALDLWDGIVCDCTEQVWGKHVVDHYDTGSAEHSDPGFVYVSRSCDCGDEGCFDENSTHDSLSVAIQWDAHTDPPGYATLDEAKRACRDVTSEPIVISDSESNSEAA